MKGFNLLLIMFLFLGLISCEEEDNTTNPIDNNNPGENSSSIPAFIVIENTGEGTDSPEYAISQMSFAGETANIETLVSLQTPHYPFDFDKDLKIDDGKLYVYNLLPGYPKQLVAFDIESRLIDTLPWASTNDDDTWAAFSNEFDAKNSYVYYLMSEVSHSYNDWAGSYLCRYNIKTGEFIEMANPKEFTLNQPEVDWDTEIGSWTSVHASKDGKSCVGSILAWGTDGGSNHYDYSIVYRYFADNSIDDRLERIGSANMGVAGATKGGKYLYHNSNVTNTESGDDYILSELKYLSYDYTGHHNDNGMLSISNYYGKDIYIYYQDIENDAQTLVVETKPEIKFAQMDKSGNFIWFGIEGDEENILCKTQDLSEGSVVDTVARYPKSVYSSIIK